MLFLAIIVGLVAWGIVGAVTGQLVVHKNEAGLFPGLVAGLWAAWPLLYQGKVQRYNFLHPVPKLYKVPLKQAFSKIRQILDETTYNFGDGWKVATADTQSRRIHAMLRFTDETEETQMDGRGGVHTKTKHEPRLLKMDVQMKETGAGTIVQFDFSARVDGLQYNACDWVIQGILSDAEAALGEGSNAGNPMESRVPAPPWWLLGLTALMLFMLLGDVMAAVFH